MNFPARYVVVDGPFAGGFGTTHICMDTNLSRKVVVKQITDKSQLKRLIDEIVALQRAKSKHVVQIYDVIVDNMSGEIAFVEEFLPQDDLTDFYASSFTLGQYYSALYQIACGLKDIHDCDIVHRDVKPNNMKRDQDNAIKIFDFGLAKVDPLPATTLALIGTPGFMAPELFATKTIDKPIDVYAFGATAFYLASGMLPPTAGAGFVPPKALAAGESIANLVPAISAAVATSIDLTLSLDSSSRPKMAEICRVIKRELLFEKHSAVVTDGVNLLVLDHTNKKIKAVRATFDAIEIAYNGYDFNVAAVSGYVEINNVVAVVGQILVGSYVVTLGAGGARKFVTFDVSHPEV